MGEGNRPRRSMNLVEANFVATFITGAEPSRPPKWTMPPGLAPGTGIIRTPVVLLLTTLIDSSSAMIEEIISGGVSPERAGPDPE